MAEPKKFDASTLTEKQMVDRLSHHADQIVKTDPKWEEEAKRYKEELTATDPASSEKRAKMLENYKKYPALAEDLMAPRDLESYRRQAANRSKMPDTFAFADEKTAAEMNSAVVKRGPLSTVTPQSNGLSGFFSNLTGGGGGFSDFFKKIGEMITKFLNGLGLGGGSSGSSTGPTRTASPGAAPSSTQAPKPSGPKPSPQPAPGAQPKAEAAAAPEAKEEQSETAEADEKNDPAKTASSTVEEDFGDVEASKPHANDAGKELGEGPVAADTAAKAAELQGKLGKTDPNTPLEVPEMIKGDQTGPQRTSSAEIPQEWAALQGKFGITQDQLDKLKPQNETVAALSEDSAGPRTPQQTGGLKLS